MDNCVDFPQLQNFAKSFRQIFLGHGGKSNSDALLNVPAAIKHNVAEAIAWAHNEVRRARGYTQLLFVVVGHKNSPHYERLKKSADCRFGILSQVVNSEAVKSNGQYHSNVCMKVNAKLGGATSRTIGSVEEPADVLLQGPADDDHRRRRVARAARRQRAVDGGHDHVD